MAMRTGNLADLTVVELADERGEYLGKLLAGNGADVVKVEPPGGSATRRIGPFVDDKGDPEGSLYFWHYNLGKRSLVLDPASAADQATLQRLVAQADVLVDSDPERNRTLLGLDYDQLRELNPRLIIVAITPFGLSSPYASYVTSDLVHMALSGTMSITGYPAKPEEGKQSLPMAPQMWQSSTMTGTIAFQNLLAALHYRHRTGTGQVIDISMHEACVYCTEGFMIRWATDRAERVRGTFTSLPLPVTKDGKYLQMGLIVQPHEWGKVVALLDSEGMAGDLADPIYGDATYRARPDVAEHVRGLLYRYIATKNADELFHLSQQNGVVWCPIKGMDERLEDPHLQVRGFWQEVEHPELGRSVRYPRGFWDSKEAPWQVGPRAPHVGEHTEAVLAELNGR
jgi:crotonobetainyl-CoA:carnitine CoA-transferase CaiB-like acyl-CoA transferase